MVWIVVIGDVAQSYKIKVSDVKLAAEKILNIEVITENVKF